MSSSSFKNNVTKKQSIRLQIIYIWYIYQYIYLYIYIYIYVCVCVCVCVNILWYLQNWNRTFKSVFICKINKLF